MTGAVSVPGMTATVIDDPPSAALEPEADVQPAARRVTARNPSETRRAAVLVAARAGHMRFPPAVAGKRCGSLRKDGGGSRTRCPSIAQFPGDCSGMLIFGARCSDT